MVTDMLISTVFSQGGWESPAQITRGVCCKDSALSQRGRLQASSPGRCCRAGCAALGAPSLAPARARYALQPSPDYTDCVQGPPHAFGTRPTSPSHTKVGRAGRAGKKLAKLVKLADNPAGSHLVPQAIPGPSAPRAAPSRPHALRVAQSHMRSAAPLNEGSQRVPSGVLQDAHPRARMAHRQRGPPRPPAGRSC
jgi:hypothetical protein